MLTAVIKASRVNLFRDNAVNLADLRIAHSDFFRSLSVGIKDECLVGHGNLSFITKYSSNCSLVVGARAKQGESPCSPRLLHHLMVIANSCAFVS